MPTDRLAGRMLWLRAALTAVSLMTMMQFAAAQDAAKPPEPKPAAVWGTGSHELRPAAEKQAVKDGWATGRRVIGGNEFWIVGPASDPAKVIGAKDAADAFKRIHASTAARFITRGDNSGTHQKEKEIWKAAALEPPSAERYIATKDFMSASLKRAEAEQGNFLTDSSTFIVERKNVPGLKLLFRGGDLLVNPYHTLWLTDPTPGTETAKRFAEFLYGAEVQAMMAAYGKDKHGEAMYSDAAATAKLIGE